MDDKVIRSKMKGILQQVGLLSLYYDLYPQRPLYEPTWRLSRWALWFQMRLRMLYFFVTRGISTLSVGSQHLAKVIELNLYREYLASRFCRRRSEHLIYLLKSIPSVKKRGYVLSIGPKNEGEILLLRAHGFPSSIGIDLFSYSPLISVADMHNVPCLNNSFDVILCGWVLRYSYDIKKCIAEIIRVARDGAHVAIAFAGYPDEPEGIATGPILRGGLKELLEYFEPNVRHVYWQMEDGNTDETDVPSHTHSTVFSIKK